MKIISSLTSQMVLCVLLGAPLAAVAVSASGQAATTPAAKPQIGTVKSVAAGTLTIGTDAGSTVNITLPDAVRVRQLAPGSTDIKTAQPAAVSDIAEGDRVLVAVKPGENGTFTASQVVLMKGAAIAQTNATRQQDWQRRGSGGIVSGVDAAAKTITLTSGARKIAVSTTPTTVFRRYAPGSVKFEEAKVGTLADIQTGDQVRVRGDKSADGNTVSAEEVVSGSFRNLAGTVVSVDAAANSLTLKDLASKKNVVVAVTSESDLRALPPEMAARFAARARGGAAGAGGGTGARAAGSAGSASASAAASANGTAGDAHPEGGRPAGAEGGGAGARRYGAGGAGGGGDLSQVIGRLPTQPLSELKPGEALMIVASSAGDGSGPVTAITLLSGVEPLLAAPQGASSFSISPWNLGGGGEGGEGGGAPQ